VTGKGVDGQTMNSKTLRFRPSPPDARLQVVYRDVGPDGKASLTGSEADRALTCWCRGGMIVTSVPKSCSGR
jgi:hypothetical protein